MTETFWDPLLRIGNNQLGKFKTFVLTPNLDTYSRAEIVTTVTQIALHYPKRRDEVIEWFREIMRTFIQSGPESGIIDSDQIGLMISDITEIQGIELIDEIEQLYNLGYVSKGISGSFESIKEDIVRKPDYEFKNKLLGIFEQYEELNGFSENENLRKNDLSPYIPIEPEPKPIIVEPKIGRNDPCPCGSGKKYKKCCLNK